MSLLDLPKTVLRLQYRFARLPLSLIEQQLRVLPADSPPRQAYQRGLGLLDGAVGNLLDDPDIASRGAAAAGKDSRREPAAPPAPAPPRPAPPSPAPSAPAASAPGPAAPTGAAKPAAVEKPTSSSDRKPARAAAEEQAPEPEKIPLADAVAEQLKVKKAEERAHNEGTDNPPPGTE